MPPDIISPGPMKLCPTCGEWKIRAVDFYQHSKHGKRNGYRPQCKTCHNRRRRAVARDTWATVDNFPLTLVLRFTGIRAAKDRNYVGICQLCSAITAVKLQHSSRLLSLPPRNYLADGTIPWLCPECLAEWQRQRCTRGRDMIEEVYEQFLANLDSPQTPREPNQ